MWPDCSPPSDRFRFSISSITYLSPTEVRTRTLDEVRELLATHPALVNATGLALPYVTVGIRATLA